MSFAYFLDGAMKGLETGMDMREKHEIYKDRRQTRKDTAASREAIAESQAISQRTADAGKALEGVGIPKSELDKAGLTPTAAKVGAGIYSESNYGSSQTPLAPVAALKRGAYFSPGPGQVLRKDHPGVTRMY